MAQPLLSGLEPVIDDVISSVARTVPAYDQPFGQRLPGVVRAALVRLLELLGRDDEPLGPAVTLYERIGAGEYEAHRPLEAVLAAYRVGALTTWRGFSGLATAAGADAMTIARLAEACFAYIDEISAVSAAGYASAQTSDAGRREALRNGLVSAVVDPGLAGQVPQLARQVGWSVPQTLTIAVWRSEERVTGLLTARIGEVTVAVLDEAGSASRWAAVLRRLQASLGTAGPLEHAAASYRHALALDRLRSAGAITADGTVAAADHLPQLLLAVDESITGALIAQELGSIAGLDAHRRAVVVDTAVSWLLHNGSRAAVARDLHIHPQTVAYRMEGIRQRFGAQLATAEGSWRLLLALRAEQLGRVSR